MDTEMQKEYCLSMANTIYQSLFVSLSVEQVGSWGASGHTAMWYKDMPSLRMHVKGMLHKGYVIISYDEGLDVFQVFLLDEKMREIRHFEEVYFDELGMLIDENIERKKNTTDTEYRSGMFQEFMALWTVPPIGGISASDILFIFFLLVSQKMGHFEFTFAVK